MTTYTPHNKIISMNNFSLFKKANVFLSIIAITVQYNAVNQHPFRLLIKKYNQFFKLMKKILAHKPRIERWRIPKKNIWL